MTQRRYLPLEPGEAPVAFGLILQYFLAGIANSLTLTVAYALFLARFGSQTMPFIYMANAVVIVLLSSAYLRFSRYVPFATGLLVIYAFLLCCLFLFRVGLLVTNADWLIFGLPILFQAMLILGNIVFWGLAGRLFNVRQGKRLFGFVGAGYWIAAVVAGFITPPLVKLIGTVNLMWIAMCSLSGAIVVLHYLTRTYAKIIEQPTAVKVPDRESAGKLSVLQNRYITLIFVVIGCVWLVFNFIDNIFLDRAKAQFPNPDEFASFFGIFIGLMGVFTLIGTAVISGKVISRYGVRTGLTILPATLLLLTSLMALSGSVPVLLPGLFWLATITRLTDVALIYAVNTPTINVIYQPLTPQQRSRTQVMVEGIVQPMAIGMAGIVILILMRVLQLNIVALGYAACLVAAIWFVATRRLGREYIRQIQKAMSRRYLKPAAVAQTLVEGGEIHEAAIQEVIRFQQNREIVIRMIRMVVRARDVQALLSLRSQLDMSDEWIRHNMLLALNKCGYQAPNAAEVSEEIRTEAQQATLILAGMIALQPIEAAHVVVEALQQSFRAYATRILVFLSFIYPPDIMNRVRTIFEAHGDITTLRTNRAYAMEMLDVYLSRDEKNMLLPILEDAAPENSLEKLTKLFPVPDSSPELWIQRFIECMEVWGDLWLQSCAIHSAVRYKPEAFAEIIYARTNSADTLIQTTASYAFSKIDKQYALEMKRELAMIPLIERIMLLKRTSFFAEVPDHTLSEVAALLTEVDLAAGDTIIRKGDPDKSLYIIATGQVRAHDNDRTLSVLGANEVFGEIAILDSAPRSSSVVAVEPTKLLRLEQPIFDELLEDYHEVARGIIRVLVQRLRHETEQTV